MAGKPAALLAALVSVAMAELKYFNRKKSQKIKIYNFSTLKQAYVRGIMLDFPSYRVLSPSISFKRGLAAWGA